MDIQEKEDGDEERVNFDSLNENVNKQYRGKSSLQHGRHANTNNYTTPRGIGTGKIRGASTLDMLTNNSKTNESMRRMKLKCQKNGAVVVPEHGSSQERLLKQDVLHKLDDDDKPEPHLPRT